MSLLAHTVVCKSSLATSDITDINLQIEIWLQRWADRGGGQKTLYVTIYFFLAICNTIGNGGYVW